MLVYNSLSRKKELFVPNKVKQVGMYVCGITPYDTTHLGHAFTYTFFDVLYRYLAFQGYTINYTQNVTDIDDDILRKAKEVNRDWRELGEWWTNKFLKDMHTLEVTPPTHYVKATETIPTMIEIIKVLLDKNLAYEKAGTVYFRTAKDTEYGKLSRYSREEMIKLSKERGANPEDPHKEDPLDFILWQKSLPDEPAWDSPWSEGRPGWHIECSSMAYQYIDKKLDIHGGGHDLLYPHHESEIAQSEAFTGEKPFANYWLHTGAVGYQGEKMSKSIGNIVMVSDLLKKYSPQTIRYLLLSHHYREPWEFKEEQLNEAQKAIKELQDFCHSREPARNALACEAGGGGNPDLPKDTIVQAPKEFLAAMDDDMNTPAALEVMHRIAESSSSKENANLRKMLGVLGFSL
ncbi:MAG: cysteine--tRNA ligase [Patescibacteria group bacterium]